MIFLKNKKIISHPLFNRLQWSLITFIIKTPLNLACLSSKQHLLRCVSLFLSKPTNLLLVTRTCFRVFVQVSQPGVHPSFPHHHCLSSILSSDFSSIIISLMKPLIALPWSNLPICLYVPLKSSYHSLILHLFYDYLIIGNGFHKA